MDEIKSKSRYLILVAVLAAIFGAGFFAGQGSVPKKVCQPEEVDFSLFWEAWAVLHEKYVDPAKFDTQELIYGAISGMVNALKDPYTVFLKPEDNKKFMEDVNGSFQGIGIEIGIKKNQLQVVSPMEGTPAFKAGLRAGDKILKIGDKYTSDISLDEAVSLIRGPKGSTVVLTILRDGWDKAQEMKIERGEIKVTAVKFEMKEDNIAYLKISQFSENAYAEYHDAARQALASGAKKIVLDLRNDPGGYLEIAQDIAGSFIEKGKTVVSEDFISKKQKEDLKADGSEEFISFPVVILINEGSASASEILAAAIRENRDNTVLVGQKSFGKGSVQQVESLPGNATLKITVAKWLTPKANQIHEVGIEPDVKVEMTDDDYQNNRDPQLDKAMELIKGM